MSNNSKNDKEYNDALRYHQYDTPGKIALKVTKPVLTQEDLSYAYSPGVAAPCLEIKKDIDNIYKYTSKGNTVAVISNGSAVLGLGNLGAAAAKPVMEGKAILFKQFADIDAYDLEVNTNDPDKFINVIKYLGDTWGGINLEDIKAPECFIIEEKLSKLMNIPVFHDDQHGTAIIVAAGLINALYLTNRELLNTKIVINGAGAAAIACFDLIQALGANKNNIILCDSHSVIYKGRKENMNPWKESRANAVTQSKTLEEAMQGCDVLLGLSTKGAVTKPMVKSMADNPIIFAMANPDPEITPEDIKSTRCDAIIATGRSDYSNQINNLMGFPYIFRGALDVRAKSINMDMKIAAVMSLAQLAREAVPQEIYKAYGDSKKYFGVDYIIPVPFDPRLITKIPVAVAKAAIESGTAQIKDLDLKQYEIDLAGRLNPSYHYISSFFDQIHSNNPKKILFAEGEEEEIIKAAIVVRDRQYGIPILVGRESKILPILHKIGEDTNLKNITITNAAINSNLSKYIEYLYKKLQRKGYLYRDCARIVTHDRDVFASCMLACGDADLMITGSTKNYYDSLNDIKKVISVKKDHKIIGYSIMISKHHQVIIADNIESEILDVDNLVDITLQTAELSKIMNRKPRVAMLSFSNFGNPKCHDNERITKAIKKLDTMNLDFEYDGDMTVHVALNSNLQKLYPFCRLTGPANILIMPGLHSAAISTHLLSEVGKGNFIGPMLNGFAHSVQIVPIGASVEDILYLISFAVIELNGKKD
ncbi:NADP-dependent malic enzyme [Rickettsia endosymbiont of Cardiosporidium cionae]|uniref:NADP-dependent malic enzyme n=1 Tax=Rickettsia endosymbiont of Cardiosporidium cionae TaxID=2777155 RepID=UPI00189475A4|nr:NADP-dependent malic enzyme [Rickettsia endosymbiont of Cardiosporidium cionae]KAF8818292.1 NADP-dependent malic enzyme [Rickettsia endosymbiont of Cardiosporidium cionae]